MIFKISKEKFWDSSAGIERWAEMLKRLPEEINYFDKNKIAEEYFNMKRDKRGRLNGSYEVYGLFGAETKGDAVNITGCNLIRKSDNGYRLTAEAIRLIKAYDSDNKWELLLMEQLLKYSLRVRTIVTALLDGGKLYFKEGYLKRMPSAFMEWGEEIYYVFYDKSDKKNLNDLMRVFPRMAVGEFWLKEFEISEDESIEIEGVSNKNPSIDSISSQIKIPMVLLEYLGFIKEVEIGYYSINKNKFKVDISKDVWDSLLIESEIDDLQILKNLVQEHKDYNGYFPVAIVGEKLKEAIDPDSRISIDSWIDKYFISGFNLGRFRLSSYQQGQPRHGRGLLGKREQQLIMIEFSDFYERGRNV